MGQQLRGVWHLPNGTSLSASDSTSHQANGTISRGTAVAGEIDGGADLSEDFANDHDGECAEDLGRSLTLEA